MKWGHYLQLLIGDDDITGTWSTVGPDELQRNTDPCNLRFRTGLMRRDTLVTQQASAAAVLFPLWQCSYRTRMPSLTPSRGAQVPLYVAKEFQPLWKRIVASFHVPQHPTFLETELLGQKCLVISILIPSDPQTIDQHRHCREMDSSTAMPWISHSPVMKETPELRSPSCPSSVLTWNASNLELAFWLSHAKSHRTGSCYMGTRG